MISFCFLVRPSKLDKKGLAPIEIALRVNGKSCYLSTHRKCNPKCWNTKTYKVKGDKSINDYLIMLSDKLYQAESRLIKENIPVTLDLIRDMYNDKPIGQSKPTLLFYMNEQSMMIQNKVNNNLLEGTSIRKFNTTIKDLTDYLEKFYSKSDIDISEVNNNFCNVFLTYLMSIKSHNTAVGQFKRFKTVIINCFNNGIITRNPFIGIKLSVENKDVEFLSENEIHIIEDKEITNKRLSNVRDCFIFECYTGLAYIDLKELTRDYIVTDDKGINWIFKPRQKTKVTARIPLLDKPFELLKKYDYRLPVLSNQKYNTYLKEIQDICGIKKSLHTHIARHSFACMMLNKKVSMEAVSKMLGHTNLIQTSHYAKLVDRTVADEVFTAFK